MTGSGAPKTVLALLSVAAALTLPAQFGWASSVVGSGSMSPAAEAGDVVITSPPAKDRLIPGYVIKFDNPSRPGRPMLHRIAGVTGDGLLITRGDANPVPDLTPVPPASVTGWMRLRVPYLGLPVLWWVERNHVKLAMTALAVAAPLGWWGVARIAVPLGWKKKARPR